MYSCQEKQPKENLTLLMHPEIADEYGRLKLALQKKYGYDRDGYTNAKTDFIKRVVKLARAEISTKY